MKGLLESVGASSENIAGKDAIAYKSKEVTFVSHAANSGLRTIGYVTNRERVNISKQGEIETTTNITDLAIQGNGLFLVKGERNGEISLTRRGDFRLTKDGNFVNGAGQSLIAEKAGNDGNLPPGQAKVDDLVTVNIANVLNAPIASTSVGISMNLNSRQGAIRGNGLVISTSFSEINKEKAFDDILYPEKLQGSKLELGAKFNIQSIPPSNKTGGSYDEKVITYGGIASGYKVGEEGRGNKIFSADDTATKFTFSKSPHLPSVNSILSGNGIKIEISDGESYNKSYTFSSTLDNPNRAEGTFNSLNNLAEAINSNNDLRAGIDSNGRIHIAPSNANYGLRFTNSGGYVVEALGLQDLSPALVGENRFNTFDGLTKLVNKDSVSSSLLATYENGKIDLTSLLAEDYLEISAESLGINQFTRATLNPEGTDRGRATVSIVAPNNGLLVGDLVRIKDTQNTQMPDGVYSVTSYTENNFTVALIEGTPSIASLDVREATTLYSVGSTWEKVAGETFETFTGATIDTSGTNMVTIKVPAGTADIGPGGENWVDGDVVYISEIGFVHTPGGDDIFVPDGYYEISNSTIGPRSSTLTISNQVINGGGGAIDNAQPFSIRKVGTGGLGTTTGTFDNRVFVTTGGSSQRSAVRMFLRNSTYGVGDIIKFTDLPEGGVMVDGLNVANNTNYSVSSKDSNYIEFQILNDQNSPLPATTGDGMTNSVGLSQINPFDFSIDNFSRLYEYFGIQQDRESYSIGYDPNDETKNLTSGKFKNDTFEKSLDFTDSLGTTYQVNVIFAKVNSGTWAIEVSAVPDKNGLFDITNIQTSNGLLRSGTISFNESGKLSEITGFQEPVTIQRNNGSAENNILFDWENNLQMIQGGEITQVESESNISVAQIDGKKVGRLLNISISKDGFISGSFDNGEVENLYKIPLATFVNPDGLTPSANGTYKASAESGEMILKGAATSGVGSFISGAVEGSNVDTVSELVNMQKVAQSIRSTAKSIALREKNLTTILNEIQ